MLETLFGLVRKSRLVEAQADLALVKAGEAEANDRISRLVRERNVLSSEVIEQKRLVSSLRQSILANSQEYSRVCAKVVELSDTVRELTEKLNLLQAQPEKVEHCADVQRKRFRGRPTSRMTATDFVERFAIGKSIRPERLGLAASRLARERGIALSRITSKGADGIERSMNIYPTKLLREASGLQ